jgi:hypothetical protein
VSHGITPVAVALSQVERSLGCGDDVLSARITADFKYRFEQDERDDDDEPTLEQAVRELIGGKPWRERLGHKYSYALEMLCLDFGEYLSNRNFSGMRSSWIENIDRGLLAVAVDQESARRWSLLGSRTSRRWIPTSAKRSATSTAGWRCALG